jgi:hypothetical protein
MYFNGVQITDFSTETYPSDGYTTRINDNLNLGITCRGASADNDFDGYMSEAVFIDGQQLPASDFGEFNDDGIWVPKDVSGLTFGSKGVYLDFKVAPGTGNGAGTDVSGNTNHLTDANLVAADQVADSPTNNWCTLNSAWKEMGDSSGTYSAGQAYSNGNLDFTATASSPNRGDMVSTMGMLADGTAGAIYYAELTVVSNSSGNPSVGISGLFVDGIRTGMDIGWHYASDTSLGTWESSTSLATYTAGDVLGFIVDCENNVLWVTKDGTYQTGADGGAGSDAEVEAGDVTARNASLVSGREYHFVSRANATSGNWAGSWNFGQHAWNTEPPSNARALNETNLALHHDWAITKGSDYFSATIYTGNGSADNDINVGFDVSACMAVIKNRDQGDEWKVVDTLRGVTKELNFDGTAIESTDSNGVTAFGTVANNIRLGSGAGGYNDNTEKFVMQAWAQGVTPGFKMLSVSHTNGADTETSHGLSGSRFFAVAKTRDTQTGAWYCKHPSEASKNGDLTSTGVFTVTITVDVDATNVTIKSGAATATYYVLVWAEIAGFSRFGFYYGNANADGPFLNCSFRPAIVICKEITGSALGNWLVYDNKRDALNPNELIIMTDTAAAEAAGTTFSVDFVSNGFKLRSAGADLNSAEKYVFMAWAENPFPRSKAR